MTTGELLACPHCDALHRESPRRPKAGGCDASRCDAVMMTNRPSAIDRTLAASFASVILMVGALLFPFLELSTFGLQPQGLGARRGARLFQRADGAARRRGRNAHRRHPADPRRLRSPTSSCRCVSAARRRPARRPSSGSPPVSSRGPMAEIFIIGVVVALVKVAGIAAITLGPAFWALALPRPPGRRREAPAFANGPYGTRWNAPAGPDRPRAGLVGCRTCGQVSPSAASRPVRAAIGALHSREPASLQRVWALARGRADLLHARPTSTR